MNILKIGAVALAIMPSLAAAQTISEGLRLAEVTFESVDTAGRGYVDMGNMENFRRLVFVSQDADDNHRVSLQEYLEWDYGFSNLAAETNRELAYITALKVVHSFWDLNGDGEVSEAEHRRSIMADFSRADLNNDAILSKEEFISGFSVLVALRAALKPDVQ